MFRPQINLSLILAFVFVLSQFATGQDNQTRATAEKLQTEAEELFNKNTPADREQAALKFTESLKLWEKLNDVENQIKALVKLKDISYAQSDFKQCINYSSTLLTLAIKIGNKNLEAETLGNLGLYHHLVGESRKGLEFLEKAAVFLDSLGDKQQRGSVYANLSYINYNLGEIKIALDYLNRSLQLKIETKDRKGEGIILNNLETKAKHLNITKRLLKLPSKPMTKELREQSLTTSAMFITIWVNCKKPPTIIKSL